MAGWPYSFPGQAPPPGYGHFGTMPASAPMGQGQLPQTPGWLPPGFANRSATAPRYGNFGTMPASGGMPGGPQPMGMGMPPQQMPGMPQQMAQMPTMPTLPMQANPAAGTAMQGAGGGGLFSRR